jgi:hypothetical protein
MTIGATISGRRGRATIRLNGFRVGFDVAEFEVYERARSEDIDLRSEREAHPGWKLYADRDAILTVRLSRDAPEPPGRLAKRQVDQSLSFLKWLVGEALPSTLRRYEPVRLHPFTFVGKHRDLVAEVAAKLGSVGSQLDGFTIRPRYTLDPRLISLRGEDTCVALFVKIGTRWGIDRPLMELADAGVDLRGLYVVRRRHEPGQRRLVGRIDGFADGMVDLADTFEGPTQVRADEVGLEGSTQSFARCLQRLLGNKYERFEALRSDRVGDLLAPAAIDEEVDRVGAHFANRPLELADGLQATIGERLEVAKRGRPPNVTELRRVQYCFDAARSKQQTSAWPGLARYGPFSSDTFPKKSPRLLVVFPDVLKGRAETFIRLLLDGVAGAQGSAYCQGFARTFALIDPRPEFLPVRWAGPDDPASRYRTAIEQRLAKPHAGFDAGLVVLRDEDSQLPDGENPYLHSKALLLVAGVPTQQVLESTIADQRGLSWSLRNIATALYAKMGGTPWTVNHDLTISDEVVIGVGISEVGESRFAERQRYVGVTTVFRGDGNYLLGNLSRECSFEEYPEVLRRSTTDVLTEIKRRNGWQPGDTVRVVCHASRPLRNVDAAKIIAECVETVGDEQIVEFAFLTVSQAHPFNVVDPRAQGLRQGRGRLLPERGTVVHLAQHIRLLSVSGPSQVFTDHTPLPAPLQVTLHRASTFKDLDYLTEQVLKFTALSWRSVLPGKKPVTIRYSELIAELMGRLRSVRDWSPAPLNTSLRSSRWFL